MTARRWPWLCGLAAFCALLGLFFWLELHSRVDRSALAPRPGPLVLAANGKILRIVADEQGRRQALLPGGEIPPLVREVFVAAEDKRFGFHPGVDPLAVVRALYLNLSSGKIVSGASTITQQLARLTHPGPRSYKGKLFEMARAVRIEHELGKEEILRLYLNQLPLGGNLVGVEAAAQAYFGKSAAELNLTEAACLACLARAPGRLDPFGPGRRSLETRVVKLLSTLKARNAPEAGALEPAGLAGLGFKNPEFGFMAPHFVELALRQASGKLPADARLVTTCELDLQLKLESALASHRTRLARLGASQAAAVILSSQGQKVLALAGSLSYAPRAQGFNNGVLAQRSPGSALKPFLYALALDQGYSTSLVLDDVRRVYSTPDGEFAPANFDRSAHGPVALREALGNSLNLSAVRLLSLVGTESFFERLNALGLINHPQLGPEHYGLGLVVGNPEVAPLQLAEAYLCLARGGNYARATALFGESFEQSKLFSPQAAYIINDILSDPLARQRAFGGSQAMNPGFSLAMKTGTSTYYRDAWAVGYTRDFVIAVWCGNFDGRPGFGQSGSTAAAPILVELASIMLERAEPRGFAKPGGLRETEICAFSGLLPTAACPHKRRELFIDGSQPRDTCDYHSSSDPWHHVPGNYAAWVSERGLLGGQGKFRVKQAGFGTDNANAQRSSLRLGQAGLQGGGPSLVAPLAGSVYLADPRRGPEVKVLAQAECLEPEAYVIWYLNGVEAARSGPPYEHIFELTRGTHKIAVSAGDGFGQAVTVSVQ